MNDLVKSLFIFGILLNITIEAALSAFSPANSNNESQEENNKDYSTSVLNCVLFKDFGGPPLCSILGKAYSIPAQGKCDSSFNCECKPTETLDLDTLWERKFVKNDESQEVLKSLKSNLSNAKNALEILQTFPRTEQQSKDDLLAKFSNLPEADREKMEKLQPNKEAPANKFTLNGDIDKNAIKKFVKENFESAVDQVSDGLLQIDYQDKLKTFVTVNFPEVSRKLIRAIYQVGNEELTVLFQKTSNQNVVPSDTWEYTVPDEIAAAVIGTSLEYIKTTPKSFASLISIYRLLTPQPVQLSANIPTNRSYKKQWKNDKYTPKYSISFDRNTRITNLKWKVGDIDIKIKQSIDGTASQTWIFDKVRVNLRTENDKYTQKWDFGNNFVYEENKNSDKVTSSWSNGKSKPRLLAQYKTYIIDWCRENYSIYQLYRCVIFI